MSLGVYEIIYIISNLFMTYVIYEFMQLFYKEKITERKMELGSYFIYFIVITMLHILIKIPIVLMISNILFFLILTFNYKSSLKQRILTTFLIYLSLMCIETIIILASGYLKLEVLIKNDYQSILGIVMIRIVSYIVVLIAGRFKSIRKGGSVPSVYWLCITMIPMGTLYFLVTIFIGNRASPLTILVSTTLVMLINFTTFYLYDQIASMLWDKTEKTLMKQQNEYYENQLELMRTSLKATQTIKHDLKNHITCIYILVKDNRKEETLNYLSKVIKVINSEEGVACTGNIVIDSIINFKLQEATRQEIAVTTDFNIPKKMKIASFDITVILGNLLDNALNAVEKLVNNRYINIEIEYIKGRLLVKIENSFNGIIIKEEGAIISSHSDQENHGLGLESVRAVLEKYNGTIDFKYDESKFSTKILMHVE